MRPTLAMEGMSITTAMTAPCWKSGTEPSIWLNSSSATTYGRAHVGDAEKDVEQRGLAASRRAEYGDDLPILDGKIDILEHDMRAIRLLDVPQFEHGTPSRFLASSRPPRRYCPARP